MATQNLDVPVEASAPKAAPDETEDTHDTAVVVDTLNATLIPGESPFGLETPDEKYNPEQSRDKARATITYWLLGLLTLLFAAAFAAFFASSERSFANLKVLLDMLISPLIVLVSAATGFYFGANASSKK